ncbi:VOC family protein [Mycetocola sp. 2940]|uniref:VOC family protein n=1 Tax=Mycetocola sp. 2940 TaxID=3156452 RepID=UPI003391CAF1
MPRIKRHPLRYRALAVHSKSTVGADGVITEAKECVVDMRLELVPLVSADVDRTKSFYEEKVGFHVDHDVEPGNGMRVVQLTPPGSACSIVIGVGISEPGASPVRNLHLVVDDVEVAREMLVGNGVPVSEIADLGGGVRYAYFSDPDGNSWALQQIDR